MLDFLGRFDQRLFLLIYGLPHPRWLIFLMWALSAVGEAAIWLFLALLQSFYGSWTCVKWRRGGIKQRFSFGRLESFWRVVLVLALTGIVVWGIKEVVRRPRPLPAKSFSFPSGHAAAAFAAAWVLTSKSRSKRPKRKLDFRKLGVWGLAFLIAFSRVYLGKHYPLDVLGGAGLGLGMGWMVIILKNVKTQSAKCKTQNASRKIKSF